MAAASIAGIARKGDRFFIARRASGGDLGDKWEFPGGKVEAGESDEAALVREFREEFDCAVTVGALLAAAVFEHRGLSRDLRAWSVELAGKPVLREHREWKWAALDEIAGLDFAGSDRKLLPALRAYLDAESQVPGFNAGAS
jgi:8-oxo-dGTP diphosphatase